MGASRGTTAVAARATQTVDSQSVDGSWPCPNGAIAQLMHLSHEICRPTLDPDVLTKAVALAATMVPGSACASLTHLAGGDPARWRTIAASGQAAAALDAIECQTGEGPGLTAVADAVIIVSDFTTETRWPAFIGQAVTTSALRAALSYPLIHAGHPGTTLNVYFNAPLPSRPGVDQNTHLAAACLASTLTAVTHAERAANLANALASNRIIAAAQGVLMHRHRWTPEHALDALRGTSQRSNRKMRLIAEHVLATGGLPKLVEISRCG